MITTELLNSYFLEIENLRVLRNELIGEVAHVEYHGTVLYMYQYMMCFVPD